MFHGNKPSKYNQQMFNKAITALVLRVVVAGYIIFIAINVINGTKGEDSSIPAWVGSLVGALFIAASTGFIIYAVIQFRKALANARLDAEQVPEEKPAPKPEMTIAEKVKAAQAMIDDKGKNHSGDE